jgi:hypothetical protein
MLRGELEVKDERGIGQATKLQSVRNLEQGEIDQQVCDLEITVHRPSVWNETERDGNGAPAPPSSFIRWGALGAMLAQLAWLVSGFVAFATVVGEGPEVLGFVPLDEALNGVALVGTLVGLVSLHTWQAPSYGRLGSVGFLTSFLGVSLLLVGLVLSFLSGRILEQMLGLAFLGILFGFVLLGAATLRLGLLPWWCALLLIACPFLAINLVDYGAALALGLIWLVLGGTLLLQGDLSAFFQTSEKSEQTAETTYSRQLGE